jgi:uncharacterized DUF497 family protein
MSQEIESGLFVWDGEKERLNRERHGLLFSEAVKAFEDPFRLILLDRRHSDREIRFFCVGAAGENVITVRFTLREDKIRIIGAGRWRKWRQVYEKKKNLR